MTITLTAREAEKLLLLMNVLLEGPLVDPDVVAIARKTEAAILEQNQRTAQITERYLNQTSLFAREKPLPEA